MRLVVDENLPWAEEFFADSACLVRLPGSEISKDDLMHADGLLVRSVTQVNAELLQGTPVGFVGTATIGVDHVDQAWLQKEKIEFASAPGCNADSVVDYVLSSLLWLAQEQGFELHRQTLGIVGVGQVGGRLAQRLADYGCRLLLNDPPREAQGEKGFVHLDQLIDEADILCLHTPLTRTGFCPSEKLLGEKELQRLEGKVLLNAGRGGVIDQAAMKKQLQAGLSLTLVLDVFAGEPQLDPELLRFCCLATPHIAGYSLEGKSRGTEALYQAWCAYLQQSPAHCLTEYLPQPPVSLLQLHPGWSPEEACRRAALLVYDPRGDAARMRMALQQLPSAKAYQQLRKQYPLRREFASLRVSPADDAQARALQALGFTLI